MVQREAGCAKERSSQEEDFGSSPYIEVLHSSWSTKLYHDLRQQFWWIRMKRETARYVSKCDTCRKIKADYMNPGRLLQPLSVPEWKWDDIRIDFIVGISLMARKFNSIW
jgi:hypothetical protein